MSNGLTVCVEMNKGSFLLLPFSALSLAPSTLSLYPFSVFTLSLSLCPSLYLFYFPSFASVSHHESFSFTIYIDGVIAV